MCFHAENKKNAQTLQLKKHFMSGAMLHLTLILIYMMHIVWKESLYHNIQTWKSQISLHITYHIASSFEFFSCFIMKTYVMVLTRNILIFVEKQENYLSGYPSYLELWHQSITKTRLYNFDPLKPHFYIVKLWFTGVYIIFLISA